MTNRPLFPVTAERSDHLDAEIFRRLVESVSDYAIFLLTPQGHIASWNTGAQRLKGYAAEEAIGKHFSIFYPAEAIATGWPDEELRRASALGRFEDEGWRLRKDGSRFWANVVITAVRDDDGKLLGFAKVTRDLSERMAHERRLKESERNLRLLIEGVEDYAIFGLDPQGVITSWNTGAQRINGYTAAEIIGTHFSVFYPPEAVAEGWPQEELRRAALHGRFEDEGWRVRKNGTMVWANVIITAIRDEDGDLIGFSKVTRDLTERRRQEQLLKESEESLRLLVEGVKDHAMFLLRPDGTIGSWNSGASRMFGFQTADVVGEPVSKLYRVEDAQAGTPHAELLSATNTGFFEVEGWRLRANGQAFWSSSTLTAVRDPLGKVRAFVHIVRDLTDHMRMQELEDEGKRINQFMAMLAHELRNPLAPITNAVQILRKTSDKPEVSWCADLIGRQTGHLTRLVDDLLDVSRISSGKIQIQSAPVEMNTLLQLATEAARPGLERLGHVLTVQTAPQSIFVNGDGTRLTQVITNLLNNAGKYTPEGGHIEVSLGRQQSVMTLEVADNGIGMSESLIKRAFDPFVQGERTLDRAGGGLGIGLALVKNIVELHGGRVTLASAGPGRGTRVTVTLPVSLATPMETTGGRGVLNTISRRSRVLVVDDNADAAESLTELLRMAGHDVEVASDGPQALKAAASGQFNTVLLDIGLPGMDGYTVAKRMSSMLGERTPRLIALTGYGRGSDKAASDAAGFESHLVKPVDFDELARLLA